MRIINCQLENFTSYKNLEFDYSDQGLTLLRGLTGSGKSTLCDAVPWILFGKTAKGGSVDDVLSWPGDRIAYGSVTLTHPRGIINIHRQRGKPKDNDLWYTLDSDLKVYRGKDLPDTQRLINNLLGFDYDLYLAAAYYHEFSQTAQFFTTTAKNRRQICEQLVDLSLATRLTPALSEDKKALAKRLVDTETKIYTLGTNIDLLKRMFVAEIAHHNDWERIKRQRIGLLQDKIVNFEDDKNKTIADLLDREEAWIADKRVLEHATICSECGAPKKTHKPHKQPINPYTERLARELARANTYVEQMKELETETNPHQDTANKTALERADKELELEQLNLKQAIFSNDIDELEVLQQVVSDYRSVSIQNAIFDLETNTNKLLADHFDAEIRVSFEVADADKLDVSIHKDGNMSTFTQLSKGQRCLLKLCFGLAVMQAVQNHHGIRMDQIFLDEALDGMDELLKVKAYHMLLTIAQWYDSIFVVDHSAELKALVGNQYHVQLINGESVIEKS